MREAIHDLVAFAGTGVAAIATVYACAVDWVAATARRRPAGIAGRSSGTTPVSILKPLCGNEPRLYENLRSFCVQNHPHFQIIFGVKDTADSAVEVVRRLQSEFPDRDLQLVIDPRVHGQNLKVSNLMNLSARARYDWWVLADSDVQVGPDYLERVTAPLAAAEVGIVTCLYRGAPLGGFWSRFGAQFINDWFTPSAQLAHRFGFTGFAFGATIALRRDTLLAVGGFEAVNNVLADDFWLGELTRRKGYRTVLSDVVIATDVTEETLPSLWVHELRWMRTVRAVAPVGFSFDVVTFTFPLLAVGAALAHTGLCFIIAAIGAVARLALPLLQPPRFRARRPLRDIAVIPLRDAVLMLEWAAAHACSSVRWRDQEFSLAAERPLLPTQ
jgi:ceramide glucosyltransferase